MDFLEKEKKLLSSEGMEHERVNDQGRQLRMEGYDPHPKEEQPKETFGLKNSFDNLSVGSDREGRITIAVTSQKGFHSPSLTSDHKRIKGSRRRTFFAHFGEFYTNAYSQGEGAFAFRTRKNLPESRILRELRFIAAQRISPRQREAMPILSLEEDRKRLTELRTHTEPDPLLQQEKQAAENVVTKKTESENRFIRRMRLARQQTYFNGKDVPLFRTLRTNHSLMDDGEDTDQDETNLPDNSDTQGMSDLTEEQDQFDIMEDDLSEDH